MTKVKAFRVGLNRFWMFCFRNNGHKVDGRKFEWFYNGTALKTNKRVQVRRYNTQVKIQKPTAQDVGEYVCKEILAGNQTKTLSIFHVKVGENINFPLLL